MSTFKKFFAVILIGLLYGLIFYFSLKLELRTDFTTFYTTANAFFTSHTPYQETKLTIWDSNINVGINLNPPFFLYLLQPLTKISFIPAFFLWQIGSLLLGLAGFLIALRIATAESGSTPPVSLLELYFWPITMSYLLFYPTLMNASFGQIANTLFFLIMAGYYCYLQRRDLLAGIFWGLAIAIKIFPGLLFVFVLHQRRYFVFAIMLLCNVTALSLPLLTHDAQIYTQYFEIIHHITWYGDTGNASLLGFLARVFNYLPNASELYWTKMCYNIIAILVLVGYLFKLKRKDSDSKPHFNFCLTLTMMLLLSPFAWVYYLQLLVLPILLLWQTQYVTIKNALIYSMALILLYFPQGLILNQNKNLSHLWITLTLDSMNFYGLVLITIYLYKHNTLQPFPINQLRKTNLHHFAPLAMSYFLGIMMMLNNLIPKLFE